MEKEIIKFDVLSRADSEKRFLRSRPIETSNTRDENGEPIIEGYFAVFNSNYELWDGASESIAPGAFDNTISGDIRALINHDSTLVLGRTIAGTLELRTDSHGLWGRIRINPKDTDAMNLHARVERGDVTQCSFGFFIISEETDYRADGSVHWTLTEVELFEVSCCTFPAYEETSINARAKDYANIKDRETDAWRAKMFSRINSEGGNDNGSKDVDAPKED